MICGHDENLDVSDCIKLNVSSTTSYLMMRDRSVEHVDSEGGNVSTLERLLGKS